MNNRQKLFEMGFTELVARNVPINIPLENQPESPYFNFTPCGKSVNIVIPNELLTMLNFKDDDDRVIVACNDSAIGLVVCDQIADEKRAYKLSRGSQKATVKLRVDKFGIDNQPTDEKRTEVEYTIKDSVLVFDILPFKIKEIL